MSEFQKEGLHRCHRRVLQGPLKINCWSQVDNTEYIYKLGLKACPPLTTSKGSWKHIPSDCFFSVECFWTGSKTTFSRPTNLTETVMSRLTTCDRIMKYACQYQVETEPKDFFFPGVKMILKKSLEAVSIS